MGKQTLIFKTLFPIMIFFSFISLTILPPTILMSISYDNLISTASNDSPEIIPTLTTQYKFNYPPYLTQYKGAYWIDALEYDYLNKRLYMQGNSTDGLIIYDIENDNYTTLSLTNSTAKFPYDHMITDMVFNENYTKLYLATNNGLVVVNLSNWEYQRYYLQEKYHPILDAENGTNYIKLDQINQRLFLSTDTEGLKIFNLINDTFVHWSEMPSELQKGVISSIAFNSITNELYYDSYDTLWSYNLTDNSVQAIISLDKLYALHIDELSQQLFIAGNGVRVMNCTTYDIIEEYLVAPSTPLNIVKKMTYEPSYGGMLFLSQEDNGLIGINTTSDEQFTIRREDGLMTNDIASLFLYQNNSDSILVIGNRASINFFSIKSGIIYTSNKFDFQLPSVYVWNLSFNERDNQILLGVDEYLCIYDITTKKITKYFDYIHGFSRSRIKMVDIDEQTNLWYVASQKLMVFDSVQERVIRNYSVTDGLLDDSIFSLCIVNKSRKLFIGTHDGLNVLNLETDIIERTYPMDKYCSDILYDEKNNRLFITSDIVYVFDLETMMLTPLTIAGQTFPANELDYYSVEDILFVTSSNGLYILDLKDESLRNHFTYRNAPLVTNLIDGIYFDPEMEILFVANVGVEIYDFAHDFWLTLNDAQLIEEELYYVYVEDLCFYKNTLYIAMPYTGFTTLILEDYDYDGLFDCTEDWLFGTDKLMYDTDLDGYSDGEELWVGTDPLDPNSYPVELIPLWSRILIVIIPGFSSIVVIGISIIRSSRDFKTKQKTKHYKKYLVK
ncbi:MAG: hypothetical protein ACTSO7_07765 [Candidatus Heimdallarchaeota archaeon]